MVKWVPNSAELEEMNAWNPTGHSGRTAQFVQHMKDMFKTPADCKFFQDQVKARHNQAHIFTTPQYLSTSWDKMGDGQRVKFLKWYNLMPNHFRNGAVASFVARGAIPGKEGTSAIITPMSSRSALSSPTAAIS